MQKILMVYYSGGGNTKAMARAIKDGIAKNKNMDVECVQVGMIHPDRVGDYDKILLGCPASGMEELEPNHFEPFYEACKKHLRDKPVALFGSYGLGVGHWMKKWERRCILDGAILFDEGFICLGTPEGEMIDDLMDFGRRFSEFNV